MHISDKRLAWYRGVGPPMKSRRSVASSALNPGSTFPQGADLSPRHLDLMLRTPTPPNLQAPPAPHSCPVPHRPSTATQSAPSPSVLPYHTTPPCPTTPYPHLPTPYPHPTTPYPHPTHTLPHPTHTLPTPYKPNPYRMWTFHLFHAASSSLCATMSVSGMKRPPKTLLPKFHLRTAPAVCACRERRWGRGGGRALLRPCALRSQRSPNRPEPAIPRTNRGPEMPSADPQNSLHPAPPIRSS